MYNYNIYQWIAFFIIYCFIGWIGESLYVSWEHKKWVNRGFMNGPFLPIYGFGAIIMLFAALPVRDNILLIFLFGMLSATLLEYATGWAIEKIFKVRYWDYSYEPFNIQGYICLGCSITWGLCAMLLLRIIHSPVEKFITTFNSTLLTVLDYIFLIYFAVDMFLSVRQALDLKKIIIEYVKHNADIQRIQKRIDVIIAVINDDKKQLEQKLEESKERFEQKLEDSKDKFEQKLEKSRDSIKAKLEESSENRKKRIEEYNMEVEKLKASIEEIKSAYKSATATSNDRAFKILKRNPGAINSKHKVSYDTIKNVIDKYKSNKN